MDGINPNTTKIRIKSLNSNKKYIRSRVDVFKPKHNSSDYNESEPKPYKSDSSDYADNDDASNLRQSLRGKQEMQLTFLSKT